MVAALVIAPSLALLYGLDQRDRLKESGPTSGDGRAERRPSDPFTWGLLTGPAPSRLSRNQSVPNERPMPDYAVNELRVHGDVMAIAAFVESVAGDGPFDFDRVCPMPPETDIVQKDPMSISAPWEWRWEHWGTSRCASGAERLITDDGMTATFIFDTAWNAPVALITGLAARFAWLAFKLSSFYDTTVGVGLWINGNSLGALEQAPTTEARRLLKNTTIQALYDEWIANDLDHEDLAG